MRTVKRETKIIIDIVIVILILSSVIFVYRSYRKSSTQLPKNPEAEQDTLSGVPLVSENRRDTYYTMNLSYPSSSSTPEIQVYVDQTKKEFLDSVPKTEAEAKFENLGGDRIYNLTSITKVTHSSSTISYVLETYQFTGGAHGGTNIATFTYDRKGKALGIGDILKSPDTLSKLSSASREYFYNKFPDQDKSQIDTGTEPTSDNFSTWYIDGDKIIFVFGQYSIGPYVLGIQEFPFSL
ncbi:MAG: DUF3298 domain-containing protein [Candidatus Paceibacterota bacterium]|jgi:hypothetical protein